MFEKEAEEEINKEHWKYSIFKDLAQEYWQKGAEFGYNKANEWHYVKDGDLPKDENRVLLYFGVDDYNAGQFIRGRFWCDCCGWWFNVEEVIAVCYNVEGSDDDYLGLRIVQCNGLNELLRDEEIEEQEND